MVSIIERIVVGFKIWRKGWLSFILAVILLSLASIIILVPVILGVVSIASLGGNSIYSAMLMAFIITALSIAFNFLVVGTMCGLGKELIEIEDTRAENTLHFMKNYGLRFAAIGLIIAAVVFGPFIAVGLLLNFLNFLNILPITSLEVGIAAGIAFGILIFLIAFFLFVPFSLAIPACLIDDIGIKESVETSFQAFKKNPTVLIGLLGSFVLIFLALFSPLIGLVFVSANNINTPILAVVLATFGIVASFVALFVLFPVMCITFTKLYYDFKIPRKEEVSEEESPISLF